VEQSELVSTSASDEKIRKQQISLISALENYNGPLAVSAALPVNRFSWLFYPFKAGWQSFKASPVTGLLALVIISIVLTLTAFFLLIFENVSTFLVESKSQLQISVYLKDTIKEEDKKKMLALLQADEAVAFVEPRSKLAAMEVFREELGHQAFVLNGLEQNNPLPASFEVHFKPERFHEGLLDFYNQKLSKLQGVELVQYDRSLSDKLASFSSYYQNVIIFLVPILFLVVGFVIWTTMRLAMHSHLRELEVKKLVGSPPWYVWSPFALEGLVLGSLGSVLAILMLHSFAYLFFDLIESDLVLSNFLPSLRYLSAGSAVGLALLGGAVGFISSILAAR
jgi:cell division transport system permease protein